MTCKLIETDSPYLEQYNFVASDQSKLRAAIQASTATMQKHCHRNFLKAQYDEVYTAELDGSIVLRNFPVKTIDRLYANTVKAIQITNTDTSVTNANFLVTSDSLKLSHIASGVVTDHELTFAAYPTLTLLAAAVVSYGNGWTATVEGNYGPYGSIDLVKDQYGEAKSINVIKLWIQNAKRWFLANAEQGLIMTEFHRSQPVRVIYTAGWEASEVPEDLKQICAEIAADILGSNNAALASESIGEYSYSIATGALQRLPLSAREKLALYRDRIV